MKNILLLLVFLTGPFLAFSQGIPSSCTAPASIVSKYKLDAERLALRKIYLKNLPYQDSVLIPKIHVDSVLKALLSVYNAAILPARDTVTTILDIHTFANPVTNSILVEADSTLPWMQQLKQGNLTTSNSAVNNLITKYNLKIDSYLNFSNAFSYHVVILNTDSSYNLPPLAAMFQAIPGVNFADPDAALGDGNNLQATIFPTHIELVYSLGWEDCPVGCIKRRFWKFKVYNNCSVEFAGSYGSVYKVTGTKETDPEPLKIYPNPFTSTISFQGFVRPFAYTISNPLGQKLLTGKTDNNKIYNLEKLPAGMYWLTIEAGNKTSTFRIIRQ